MDRIIIRRQVTIAFDSRFEAQAAANHVPHVGERKGERKREEHERRGVTRERGAGEREDLQTRVVHGPFRELTISFPMAGPDPVAYILSLARRDVPPIVRDNAVFAADGTVDAVLREQARALVKSARSRAAKAGGPLPRWALPMRSLRGAGGAAGAGAAASHPIAAIAGGAAGQPLTAGAGGAAGKALAAGVS